MYISWARPIQYKSPNLMSTRCVLMLFTHLHLCLPSGHFPSGVRTNLPVHVPLLSLIRAAWPAHLILLDLIILIILGEECKSCGYSLFVHPPTPLHVTSSSFGPNILLSTLLTNNFRLQLHRKIKQPTSTKFTICNRWPGSPLKPRHSSL
jgi:hypothetical protein